MWENASVRAPSDPILCIDNEEAQPLTNQTVTPDRQEQEPVFSEGDDEDIVEFHPSQHILVTLLLAGAALGLALVVPNISVVFGLLGGTTSALLGFVVPGLLGLEMDPSNRSAWVLVVAGTIIGVVTTGVTLYSTITEAI